MGVRDQRPIVVTRTDLARLRMLIETARQRRRCVLRIEKLQHQPEAAARPRPVVES